MKIHGAAAFSALLLAACVSSDPASYNALKSREVELIAQLRALEITPIDSMPTSGSATYAGVAAYTSDGSIEVKLYSEVALTANFGASTISGSLTNFQHIDDGDLEGAITIQNGIITGNGFDAELIGSLTIDGQVDPIEGGVYGDFGGADVSAIVGYIDALFGEDYYYGWLIGVE